MAFRKFSEAYPDRDEITGKNGDTLAFNDYALYSRNDDKIGSIEDVLFDDKTGTIRYLIADTGFWVFGKKVLLPIGLAQFDRNQKRVYVDGMTKEQVENMPEYQDNMTIDRDYEDKIRNGYRSLGDNRKRQFKGQKYREENRSYPGSAALYGRDNKPSNARGAGVDQDYDREAGLYGMDSETHGPIRLYQERLIADKDRFKTGDVTVGKRVETETKEVSVPVERERVVIERTDVDSTRKVKGTPDFKEGTVIRTETYAEEADIHKEAYVREEVNVRKEVERDTVTGKETLRREELDVDAGENANVVKK
ncbi:MAG: DUF2382 domain-containing protein [Elainellaceae cyanobacterium]